MKDNEEMIVEKIDEFEISTFASSRGDDLVYASTCDCVEKWLMR